MTRRELLSYLHDFGWKDVEVVAPAERSPAESPSADYSANPVAAPDLGTMAAALADCRRCRLCQGRTQVVFGVGSPHARVMFVGEAPGADEDRLGEPFVGRAGQLLNSMLRAIGLARKDVYIANVVKCRPPGNRDPEDDEADTCLPFLWRQIELIDPTVIVTLGKVATRHLVGIASAITSYRGRWLKARGRTVLPTFHPAYLLRNPAAKAQVWADLKQLKKAIGDRR